MLACHAVARRRRVLVIEPKAQRARHAGAAVVCGAAAEADDDFLRAALHRIRNHLADAERGGANRISFVFREATHAGGLAHFHHRKFFMFDPAVTRIDLAAQRVVRLAFQPETATRIANRIRSSLAAVCHRHNVDLRIRQRIADSLGDVFRDFARIERAFKFVRGDEDFHNNRGTMRNSGILA